MTFSIKTLAALASLAAFGAACIVVPPPEEVERTRRGDNDDDDFDDDDGFGGAAKAAGVFLETESGKALRVLEHQGVALSARGHPLGLVMNHRLDADNQWRGNPLAWKMIDATAFAAHQHLVFTSECANGNADHIGAGA